MNYDFLAGFSQRMEFFSAITSIVSRTGKDREIESMFKDRDFENLIVTVLCFILEESLASDEPCTLETVAAFLQQILPKHYGIEATFALSERIARYMVRTILQNSGEPFDIKVKNYETGQDEMISIRLIKDNPKKAGSLMFTDQGYELMFRTKEVDQVLELNFELLRTKELIKRKRYGEAWLKSINVLAMIRQRKNSIRLLMDRIRQNVFSISFQEYEDMQEETFSTIWGQREKTEELISLVNDIEEEAKTEKDLGLIVKGDPEIEDKLNQLGRIKRNLIESHSQLVSLLNNKSSLKQLYEDTAISSATSQNLRRFDFDEVILRNMEQHPERMEKHFYKLLNSLMKMALPKYFNPFIAYERQIIIREANNKPSNILDVEKLGEDKQAKEAALCNKVYQETMLSILETVAKGENMHLSELLTKLEESNPERYTFLVEKRLFFTTLLHLSDLGFIDLSNIKENRSNIISNESVNFDIDYTVSAVLLNHSIFDDVNWLYIDTTERRISIPVDRIDEDGLRVLEEVQITDFIIKVG